MLRPRPLLLACLLAALAAAASAVPAAAQARAAHPRFVARAAGFDDTGSPAPGAPLGGWAAAQWDLTGPFGIRAPEAWSAVRARGRAPGQGVTVAVLDTGVAFRDAGPYRRSPDLSPAHVVRGRDFVTPGDGAPTTATGTGRSWPRRSRRRRGTAYGMVGIAYGARIMPVRVLNGAGNGSAARVARGMRWAVDHGADVLNVSIELYDRRTPARCRSRATGCCAPPSSTPPGTASSSSPRRGTRRARASRRSGSTTTWSSSAPRPSTAASATTRTSGPASTSSRPAAAPTRSCPAIPTATRTATPGRNVLQVSFRRPRYGTFLVPRDQQGTIGLRGTSMAAPHVAAAVAVLLSARTLGGAPVAARGPAAARQRRRATWAGAGPTTTTERGCSTSPPPSACRAAARSSAR